MVEKIYKGKELWKMRWHALKGLAGRMGCRNIKANRDFYVDFILEKQCQKLKDRYSQSLDDEFDGEFEAELTYNIPDLSTTKKCPSCNVPMGDKGGYYKCPNCGAFTRKGE